MKTLSYQQEMVVFFINLDEAEWARNSTATPHFSLNETATSAIGQFLYSMLAVYIII